MSRDKDIFDKGVPWISFSIAFIVGCLLLGWIVKGNDFFVYKFFAPPEEAVRREVFVESQSYNDSMAQDLARAQIEYIKANPEQKQALAGMILHQFAGYDDSKLPTDLRAFLNQLKQSQGLK